MAALAPQPGSAAGGVAEAAGEHGLKTGAQARRLLDQGVEEQVTLFDREIVVSAQNLGRRLDYRHGRPPLVLQIDARNR